MKLLRYSTVLMATALTVHAQSGSETPRGTSRPPAPQASEAREAMPRDNVLAAFVTPREQLRAAALKGLDARARDGLERVVQELRDGRTDAAMVCWESLVTRLMAMQTPTPKPPLALPASPGLIDIDALVQSGPIDIDALVQWVMRAAWIDADQDLRSAAETIRRHNELKKRVRDSLSLLKQWQSKMADELRKGFDDAPVTVDEPVLTKQLDGSSTLSYKRRTLRTEEEWRSCIGSAVRTLAEATSDFNRQCLTLQHKLQQEHQAFLVLCDAIETRRDRAEDSVNNDR